ncbi:MAG: hypothetical protein L0Y72_30940, partial [Gemmataceae bacterium]|nr:hypothetical protein [Gemmataceae bacterium]
RVDYKKVATARDSPFRDDGLPPGVMQYYFVTAFQEGKDGAASAKIRTQPRSVEGLVVSMISPTEARLTWPAPVAMDIAGYHIERAVVEVFSEDQILRLKKDTPPLDEPSVGAVRAIGPFQRLTKTPIKEKRCTDTTIDLGKPAEIVGEPIYSRRFQPDQLDADGKPYQFAVYAYRVIAVNRLGVESGAGPYALTIPSSPQWLFSREEGATCQLKWAANPEEKLRGYRVYRMESPRINGPGQKVTRVTADPIADPRYSDAAAGKVTRRYWIVAVDALGQEGFPSAPAWHEREYKRYYVPFTGEWHQ